MEDREYLVSYGNLGDFGRFRAAAPLACRRGQKLVVRSPRGRVATPRAYEILALPMKQKPPEDPQRSLFD